MDLQLQESILNQTDVSLSLAKHVISTHAKDANLVFSPLFLRPGYMHVQSAQPRRTSFFSGPQAQNFEAHLVGLKKKILYCNFEAHLEAQNFEAHFEVHFAPGHQIPQTALLSLHVLLGLIASGSNGPTRYQLLGFLKSKSTEELNSLSSQIGTAVLADGEALGGPRLSFANGVWVDRSVALKPTFKQTAENDYMAVSTNVDFQNKGDELRKEVNAWGEKETNGLIREILPPDSVDASTMLILANAVYFKGAWEDEFNASFTKDDEFFLLNGTSVQAPFMTSWNKQCIRAFDGFKVLGMPYKHGEDYKRNFSMYVFLPDAKDGLPSLVEKISSEPRFIQHHLPPCQAVKVKDFRIPKFKISFDFEASEVLKAQGVDGPFTKGGLSEMVDDSSVGKLLYVSKIFHRSFIEVNEKGTEAAAVSAAYALFGCAVHQEPPIDFVADHPFVFIIREDITEAVLFIGQVVNPLAS